MRRVTRCALSVATQKALDRHQETINQARADGTLNVERQWKGARKTKPLQTVLKTLKQMAGMRERCMYCGDSHVDLLQLDRREALEAGYRKPTDESWRYSNAPYNSQTSIPTRSATISARPTIMDCSAGTSPEPAST
jgi:hypothetical protein